MRETPEAERALGHPFAQLLAQAKALEAMPGASISMKFNGPQAEALRQKLKAVGDGVVIDGTGPTIETFFLALVDMLPTVGGDGIRTPEMATAIDAWVTGLLAKPKREPSARSEGTPRKRRARKR